MFECVESSFIVNKCLRQGSVEAPRLWQKVATQILANVEEEWMRVVFSRTSKVKEHIKFRIVSYSEENLEQTLRDLIEEASSCDLVPKPASLWWTSTYDSEEMIDMILGTTSGCYKFPFEDEFKILGCAMKRQGKSHDAIEERMQSANKAFRKDFLKNKSKDVPWKVKCQRLVATSMQSLRLGLITGPYRLLGGSKDGKPRRWCACADSEDTRKKHGSSVTKERAI